MESNGMNTSPSVEQLKIIMESMNDFTEINDFELVWKTVDANSIELEHPLPVIKFSSAKKDKE